MITFQSVYKIQADSAEIVLKMKIVIVRDVTIFPFSTIGVLTLSAWPFDDNTLH